MLAAYSQLIQFASVTYTSPAITGLHTRFQIDWIIFLLVHQLSPKRKDNFATRVPGSRTLTRVTLLFRNCVLRCRQILLPEPGPLIRQICRSRETRGEGRYKKRQGDISCGNGREKRARFVHLWKSLKLPKAAQWRRISRSPRGWRAGEAAGGVRGISVERWMNWSLTLRWRDL